MIVEVLVVVAVTMRMLLAVLVLVVVNDARKTACGRVHGDRQSDKHCEHRATGRRLEQSKDSARIDQVASELL